MNGPTSTTSSPGTTTTYLSIDPPTKKWYRSKANWTAAATFVGAAVPLFLATNTGLLGDALALQVTGFTAGISAIMQFAIRTFWTSDPVG